MKEQQAVSNWLGTRALWGAVIAASIMLVSVVGEIRVQGEGSTRGSPGAGQESDCSKCKDKCGTYPFPKGCALCCTNLMIVNSSLSDLSALLKLPSDVRTKLQDLKAAPSSEAINAFLTSDEGKRFGEAVARASDDTRRYLTATPEEKKRLGKPK